MLRLTKSVEKRIAIQLGLDREKVREAVYESMRNEPYLHLVKDKNGVYSGCYAVVFPSCKRLPKGGVVCLSADLFVKESK